ncbi:hypothetical protein [Macrococcus equipercicus]|nr:hypothetical protein [Macrococcus equipercicus]
MKNKLTKTLSLLTLLAVLFGVGTYTVDKDTKPAFVEPGGDKH